jgi:hypothetical protein
MTALRRFCSMMASSPIKIDASRIVIAGSKKAVLTISPKLDAENGRKVCPKVISGNRNSAASFGVRVKLPHPFDYLPS